MRSHLAKRQLQCLAFVSLALCTVSHAESRPYYLASSDAFGIQFWKVDTVQRNYKLVATWKAPERLTVRTISAFPKSRKLLVSADSSENSKVFTVSLSGDGKVSSVDHNWIGYGYPFISPSERTVAVVGWDGCHGYIDLQRNRRDAELSKVAQKGYGGVGAWTVGEFPRLGIHGVASWTKEAEQIRPFKISRYSWKGERVTETLQFRLPVRNAGISLSVGVALEADGSFIRVDKDTIKRVSGTTGRITERTVAASNWENLLGIGPGPNSNGLSLIRNSTGALVILSAGGEAFSLSRPQDILQPLTVGILPAINTQGNGEVAMAGEDGIRIGRWVGARFYQTILIPGKYFKQIVYLGPISR